MSPNTNPDDDFFDESAPIHTARAPGRLDLMGGIADYSGSLVLQLAIAAEAEASVQWAPAAAGSAVPVVLVRTTDPMAAGGTAEVKLALSDLLRPYSVVRAMFAREPAMHWASYVAGAITVLHEERNVHFERGVRIQVASVVPAGKGVSSSAAIEVATMRALEGLLRLSMGCRGLALLCQRVENEVAGAPCGVMDQMTASCAAPNTLMALLCQPAELRLPVTLPPNVMVVGVDSGVRHAVTGSDYVSVRAGAFMGLRIMEDLAGGSVGNGYLANVTPTDWASRFRDRVPETIGGAEFLDRYGATRDPVTTVDRDREYAVRAAAAHPIHEHPRVRRFGELLESAMAGRALPDQTLSELGELMYQSHASYGACGLGSDGTDRLVELVREAGPASGLFGAKITGGGSGGTVAVLARAGSRAAIEDIARRYEEETGREAPIIE